MAKLTDRQRKKLMAEYANGLSQSTLAKAYGITQSAVSQILASDPTNKNLLKEKADRTTAEVSQELEDFIRNRSAYTNEMIELTQKRVIDDLRNGKISVKEAVGACKVFAELTIGVPKAEYKEKEQPKAINIIVEDASNGTDD